MQGGCARHGGVAAILLAAPLASATSLHAAQDCAFALQGEGRIAAWIDSRTLRMSDGAEIRLAGLELLGGDAVPAEIAALVGRDVTLHGDSDMPDRYGRQSAFVFTADSEPSLQNRVLQAGGAVVAGTISQPGCARDLATAERSARRAQRGIWAHRGVIKNAESPGDILADVGRFAIVEGRVVSVREAGAVTYLNFGRRWTQDFAVTISRRMMAAFEAAGITAKSLERQRIRVRGWIERRGGPRIEAVHAGQIEVVGDNRATNGE